MQKWKHLIRLTRIPKNKWRGSTSLVHAYGKNIQVMKACFTTNEITFPWQLVIGWIYIVPKFIHTRHELDMTLSITNYECIHFYGKREEEI